MERKPHFYRDLLLLSFFWLDCASSFHLLVPSTVLTVRHKLRNFGVQYRCSPRLPPLLPLSSSDENDWYSDFKPGAYSNQDNWLSTSSLNRNSMRTPGRGGDRRTGDQGRGQGRGGSAQYVRDTSMDKSQVDVEAVERLLERRTAARRRNDFEEADVIRSTLLNEFGVQVWDRDGIWRTGASASGSGMRRREATPQPGRGRGSRPPRPPKEFGPTGHDYQLSQDAGLPVVELSEEEIHSLIAARLRAKMSRNFEKADQIQSELTEAGVYIHDGRKEWRADGVMFGDYAINGDRPGRERGSRRDRDSPPYEQSPYSLGIDSLSEEEIADITSMVSRRAGAKLSRNFKTADRIRDELKAEFNVFLEDRLRQWSVGGDFGPDSPSNQDSQRFQPWQMSPHSNPVLDEEQESSILMQLEKRDKAKASRDFDMADDIRDLLLKDFNVVIEDRPREWSIGGDFGVKENAKKRKSYIRRGGGDLTVDEEAEISEIVEERARAKKNRDFDNADELRDILDRQFSVKVDDKTKEWWVKSDSYSMRSTDNGLTESLGDETIEYITDCLKERLRLKNLKDFGAADEIRHKLHEQFGVTVDDRYMEWAVELDEFTVLDRQLANAKPLMEKILSNSFAGKSDFNEELDIAENIKGSSALDKEFEVAEDIGTVNGASCESTLRYVDLENLTVPDLKEKLRALGLPVSGKKAELIVRLIRYNQ